MKITIEFDSCWQTSFLDGDPNKVVNNKVNKREFIATTKTRGEKFQGITLNTILGVLSRLIGDQRKLCQAKQRDFYFDDIVNQIRWFEYNDQDQLIDELIYLTNKSDSRCAQSSYLGVLDDDEPWFFTDNSHLLWSVLFLNKVELIDFIVGEKINNKLVNICDPKSLISRINEITNSKSDVGAVIKTFDRLIDEQKLIIDKKTNLVKKLREKIILKPAKTSIQKSKYQSQLIKLLSELNDANQDLEYLVNDSVIKDSNNKLNRAIKLLSEAYPDENKRGEEYCKNGIIYPSSIYSAALYLQAGYLLESGYDMKYLLNSKGKIQIQGFSKRGFNGIRDWLNSMTGKRKKSVGTPCIVNKHSGKLEINLGLDRQHYKGKFNKNISRAEELSELIENAGVSSFYLGKKGLAYVSNIRI